MNLKEIKEIINLMNEHNLSEIEIEKGEQKIKLKKTSGPGGEVVVERPALIQAVSQASPEVTGTKQGAEAQPKNLIEIKAPIVGTFYKAPSPDASAFVEVGQEIEVGEVVCIIEAMKLMNEIKSEVKGKVVDILAENADPVEFGQILFLIEPTQ
ncbi:MAG: acetyl-CoA carboxylase biotin carboxyl carrier protein [Candidatus Omnitrophica bacterium]|nr:acetyl-CoA carboxylase biotin carboxyl carrier protein [Candidatus Omnitrophota bacterium]